MTHYKSWQYGISCYTRIADHIKLGFSRTYESDDPLQYITIDPADVEISDWHELCTAAGVVYCNEGIYYLIGREQALHSVAKAAQEHKLVGRTVLSGFRADFYGVCSERRWQDLQYARNRMVSPVRLAHKVSEMFPHLRNYDHGTDAEIVLHTRAAGVKAGGVLFPK